MSTATSHRSSGKLLHDTNDYTEAAKEFNLAAETAQKALLIHSSTQTTLTNSSPQTMSLDEVKALVGEYTTAKLHGSLCALKLGEYKEALELAREASIKESEPSSSSSSSDSDSDVNEYTTSSSTHPLSEYVNLVPVKSLARSHFRAARASQLLGQTESSKEDARIAAFLGDDKGAALYGRIIRDEGGMDNEMGQTGFRGIVEEIGNQDFGTDDLGGLSALTGLGGLGGMKGIGGGNSPDGSIDLLKSFLTNALSSLSNPSTRTSIASFCQSASPGTVLGLAAMAGADVGKDRADSISRIAKSITEDRLEKAVIWTGRIRKVFKVIKRVGRMVKNVKWAAVWILLWMFARRGGIF
ncbi:hypothetical protein TrCOL_g4632 [Triparma columacea]|nr:hypothetical protein TrCOL_g4632 [Triparma columacea]